jgi:nucleotide-binding universal stress UspA family protein
VIEESKMNKILLAYDGTEPAQRALDTAAELAKSTGATVSVVSVVPMRPGRFPIDPWDTAVNHTRELVEARRLLGQRGIEADLIERAGDPARTIEEVADEGGFDTIVIGSRGLGMLGRVLQGSVSEHVATHAQATVIVAR